MQNNSLKRQLFLDKCFVGTTRAFALLVLLILGGILVSLIIGAYPAMKAFGLGFLTSAEWDVVAGEYGALAPIYGTLVTSVIALGIAVPISFGIAIFLTELCPAALKKPLGTAIELLAGIPSIIYGMWGLFVFAPIFAKYIQPALIKTVGQVPIIGALFSGTPMGIGLFAAGLILAIMIIPFIASVMRDVFEVTPTLLKESAYGLGSTRWEVVRHVVLPYTKAGVVGGIILGLGRALGETMAVTFIIGNTFNVSADLFGSGVSITSALANEFAEAVDLLHLSSLLFLGLILFVITFIVLCLSKLMLLRLKKNEGRAH
ncbi:MAG: phosphate ABC transporter permease subunit PstC [Moraxella sp.]|nr:phosphate ABC transporter permease subunit PstC [Moraxella sp.]